MATSSTPLTRNRLPLLLSLAIFIAACSAHCSQILAANHSAQRSRVEIAPGYILAALGWLGPLGLSIAWYANIPYLYCLWRLLRDDAASWGISLFAFGLALTAMLPHAYFSGVDGWHLAFFVGPAVWLWLSAFAVNLIPAWLSRPDDTSIAE